MGLETMKRADKKNTQVENKTAQLVHLCHWKPVKSPCVFVRVRVNKTGFEEKDPPDIPEGPDQSRADWFKLFVLDSTSITIRRSSALYTLA
ncbi:hypothetical protein NQZ68_032721 [Dissostichus eleginoides]|nr:hypothetical protein NQZ68_032721 [Dissostichus eleginoides]